MPTLSLLLLVFLVACPQTNKRERPHKNIIDDPPAFRSPSAENKRPNQQVSQQEVTASPLADNEKLDNKQQTGKLPPAPAKQTEQTTDYLVLKLYFASKEKVLYPVLEIPPIHLTEITELSLKHSSITHNSPDSSLQKLGTRFPTLNYVLQLQWLDKHCRKELQIEDTSRITEIVCR